MLEIDTWLMSCRVLGRRMEEAVLDQIAGAARRAGVAALVGRFIPSVKNKMVADHYAKLGFAPAGDGPDGATVWRLDLDGYDSPDLPMRIAVLSEIERGLVSTPCARRMPRMMSRDGIGSPCAIK